MKSILIPPLALALTACCGGSGTKCAADAPATTQSEAATPMVMADSIPLAAPDLKSGGTIMQAIAERRSSREFDPAPLSYEQVSEVLWAAAGVNREEGKLTAPSALALYPVTVYAIFAQGVYRYDSQRHTLVRVAEGDHRNLAGMQDFVYTAPLNLAYIADLTRYDPHNIDRERGRLLSAQDAAGYAENVNLYAAGKGLRAITRGSYKQQELLELLGLGSDHEVVLAQTVGR